MAKKQKESAQPAQPASSGGGPLVIFLLVLLVLVGMADAFLWGVLGYGYYRNTHPDTVIASQAVPTSEAPPSVPLGAQPEEAPAAGGERGNLGKYNVEIQGAKLGTDYEGNRAIIITYAWTNNSEETTSAALSILEKAFQDGVELEPAYSAEGLDLSADGGMKDVRPGTTVDVQCAFRLTSETSIVEFELTEAFSFSNDMVSQNFDPTALS